jgi:hypothetical protein
MKAKNCLSIFIVILLLLFSFNITYGQEDASDIIHSCGMNNASYNLIYFPVKPPITGDNYMRILIVYVMFDGETKDPNNLVWPANTTTGPSYKGTMLAQEKNAIPDWWNAYNTQTQSISSWFCENSRGKTHVIGNEYFVKLSHTVDYYLDPELFQYQWERENAINAEIYENLKAQDVDWPQYDKWTSDVIGNQYYWGSDFKIDMIYKVHRYKYYDSNHPENALFSDGANSGYAYLGYGSKITTDPYVYEIDYNGQTYKILGGFPSYHYFDKDGSGLTVVGNGTSGVLDKWGAFGRLMHENGHYFFGGDHGNLGMMGDVWDLSYNPWEKLTLGYLEPTTSYIENSPYQEFILDDISARTSNGIYVLKILTSSGHFLISSRYKISYWDRPMQGDVAHFGLDTYHGKGTYIYHNNSYYHPNTSIDLECADGLWKWVQNGYDTPDWNPNVYLCVLNKTEVVKFPNDQNDNGLGVNVNQNPNTAKDGLTIRGTVNAKDCPKYFSKGKKGINNGCGTDRIETNTDWENWTSREFQVDRWDAWSPGYNEIFSPYSSPSTIQWVGGQPTGVFIWIKDYNENTNQTTVRIYRDAAYNLNGMTEKAILAATPPSRPMGIAVDYWWHWGEVWHPRITWIQNKEPDMVSDLNGKLKYRVYRAMKPNMNQVPGPPEIIANNLEFYPNETPTYIDYQILGYMSTISGDDAWLYPVRYWVKAVDINADSSVFSDFASAIGINDGSYINPGGGDNISIKDNIPKKFDLKQNYPNPFNPVTNIKYDLPKNEFVTIKIYDLLGREIKTLVNEYKNPGSYIVTFNGTEFASGIYFYRMQAGSFVQVKRMVLIK